MQLKYWKNIRPAEEGIAKVGAVTWSSSGKRLAVATADRIVYLFDENGEKRDRFPTKPSDKGQKNYVIRGLDFSPDGTKIAVAQSDNIVFVYKIGNDWGEKKSICNKLPASSSVTCMCWPTGRQTELVYGLAEGKVRMGMLRNNKSSSLYSTDNYVVSIASNRDGSAIISGHLDGSVFAYNLNNQNGQKIMTHHSVPYGLGWGENICCAGNDNKVAFYDHRGNLLQKFDYTNDDKVKDFTCAAFNPGGDGVVVGNFNRFYIYNYNSRRGQWEEAGVKNIENYYSVTALCWKNDGSKLITGSLCGSADIFDASMKKMKFKGKFELNYVSPNQIIVKTLADGSKCVVKSKYAPEITNINIQKDRYVVASTYDSLLLGDLVSGKVAEVQWKGSGQEKYDFSNPNVCMILNAGELILVEYGNDDILGTCRTEYTKASLISARLSYGKDGQNQKIIAYLLDNQTITIQDLSTSSFVGTISHDHKIDYLELNPRANKLLFRDKKKQLYLFDIKTQSQNTLLNYCSYAQWVPQSEVVVAQNRNNLSVWYSIENPDKVTIYSIKGDVESVERGEGKTEVIVNDNGSTVAYALDETPIEFGFAIEQRDLVKAMEILGPVEMNPETEANWRTLAKVALQEKNVYVAERCYSALGDIARANYLHQIIKLMEQYKKETGSDDGLSYYKVQARIALLEKQFYKAETIYLEQNEIDEAMEMYQELHKWDDSIKIAEKKNHPDVKDLKNNYFEWLLETNQEEKAAEVKENEGDYIQAINLYLKGGLPARAAAIVNNYSIDYPSDLLQKIAMNLINSHMFERAGEFFEKMDQLQKALDAYCKGDAYRKAVDLAKRAAPQLVLQLEERWGDWLVSQRQYESAINRYLEAGAAQKAIEASISARQWSKAISMLEKQSPELSRPFYKKIGKHYADVRQYDLAEKYYVRAGAPVDAFELYIRANKWELALKVARENLREDEIVELYARAGQRFAEEGLYKEAEKLFLTIDQPDYAINVYKKAEQWDNMIRLVAKHRKHLLADTHLSIAQRLERNNNLKQAENHYIQAGSWHGAVEMYKNNGLWEDAIRVCRINGSEKETSELAKKWAESLGPEAGMKMLLKMNLVDAVIEYLIDRKEFQEAFKMAKENAKHKTRDVHLKYAFFLEDENRFKEAEEEFIKAGKPNEAVNMYEHQEDWVSALQVARQYDPQGVPTILLNQGRSFMQKGDFARAEQCFIQAKKPEMAIKMYLDRGSKTEAMRVAKKHAPQLVNQIHMNLTEETRPEDMSGDEIINSAKLWEDSREWVRAIDTYLEVRYEHFPDDTDKLEHAWEKAVQLVMTHDKQRAQEIVSVVCKRFRDIRKFDLAAEFYEQIGYYEEAVVCYIGAKNFDRAQDLVSQIGGQLGAQLAEKVKQAQIGYYAEKGQGDKIIDAGDVKGLDVMASQGQWQNVFEHAKGFGNEILSRYLMRYAKQMMESGKFYETITAFAQYGFPYNPNYFSIYKDLTLEIFVECDQNEIKQLRTALTDFVGKLQDNGEDKTPIGREFVRYLDCARLLDLKSQYQQNSMEDLICKLSVSLLRYVDLIRADKVFYDAGMECKKLGYITAARLLLNRYLDVFEYTEDPKTNSLEDEPDFNGLGMPAIKTWTMPESNLINPNEKQQLSDWLVDISMKEKESGPGLQELMEDFLNNPQLN